MLLCAVHGWRTCAIVVHSTVVTQKNVSRHAGVRVCVCVVCDRAVRQHGRVGVGALPVKVNISGDT